jgi:hypothetical protein
MNAKQIILLAVVFLLGGAFGGGIVQALKSKAAAITG